MTSLFLVWEAALEAEVFLLSAFLRVFRALVARVSSSATASVASERGFSETALVFAGVFAGRPRRVGGVAAAVVVVSLSSEEEASEALRRLRDVEALEAETASALSLLSVESSTAFAGVVCVVRRGARRFFGVSALAGTLSETSPSKDGLSRVVSGVTERASSLSEAVWLRAAPRVAGVLRVFLTDLARGSVGSEFVLVLK